ncbi:MAG: hypothetical protein IJ549_03480 [Prevotella sp.]|nr:hypothetical protein [Prevotella sp.]MBQ9652148.1 hypothetical protein [Prevotella sp.]
MQSCCAIPYFVTNENISWTSSDTSDVFAYEFAVVNPYSRIKGFHLFQYVSADDSMWLTKENIRITQDGKPLKFKIRTCYGKRRKLNTVMLPHENVLLYDIKAKLLPDKDICVVQRDFPHKGDSMEVRVSMKDSLDARTPGIFGDSSLVGNKLWRFQHSTPLDAKR